MLSFVTQTFQDPSLNSNTVHFFKIIVCTRVYLVKILYSLSPYFFRLLKSMIAKVTTMLFNVYRERDKAYYF